MIKSALVYIRRNNQAKAFIGCGTVLVGDVIATCRHVWRDATAGIGAEQPRTVLVEYPPDENRAGATAVAELADECAAGAGGKAPDLVLLRPEEEIGTEIIRLLPAVRESSETGAGYSLTVIYGREENRPTGLRHVQVDGTISLNRLGGLRQFSGSAGPRYWFAHGSSGSPAFAAGEQLAGMITLSETSDRPGEADVHEAFVVPGTTIRRYLQVLSARPTAVRESIPADRLQPILAAIGADEVSVAEIPERLRAFIEAARALEAEPVAPNNHGEDVAGMIAARRQLVLDPAGARRLLTDRIKDGRERLLTLLRERAEIERLVFDHEAAKATRQEIVHLAPDDAVNWIELGDLWRLTGPLDQAADAFGRATVAASGLADERTLGVSHNKLGDVRVAQGDLDGALAAYTDGMRIREALAARDPANTALQRDLSVSHDRLGDVRVALGDLNGALASYTEAMRISEGLVARDPANTEWQRDLSVSHDKLGDVRVAQGDLDGALAAYTDGMRIRGGAARDPANTESQRDLSVSHNKLGDVRVAQGDLDGALAAYSDGMRIREGLAARDPANTAWQRDLSVSHERLGDIRAAQGDLRGALAAYTDGMRISERLAARDPANTAWQRDLSVSHDRLGDVRRAQGDLEGALAAYSDGMRIREALAARDPANTEWQRDLSVSHNKLGDVRVAQGDLDGALASYTEAMRISEGLVARDPANTEWQRDLSVSHNGLGGVRAAQGDLDSALAAYTDGMRIREGLVARHPANTEWQRDLSVSHNGLGDVRVAQGDLDGALASYTEAMRISEGLVARHPANTEWQRDLSVSHNGLGDVRVAQGDLDGALASYTEAMRISEGLAARDPANTQWQRDLIVSCMKLADVAPAQAAGHLRRALATARNLENAGRLAPRDSWLPEDLKRRLSALDGGAA